MKQFLSGILSFTLWDNLILLPFIIFLFACFNEKAYFIKGLSLIAGIFFCFLIPLDIPYFIGVALIFAGLKFSGFFKQKKKLLDNGIFTDCLFAFISGAVFFVYLLKNKDIFYLSGLSIPLFLAACAACSAGTKIKKSKNLCGAVLIFYGAVFPILKYSGVI